MKFLVINTDYLEFLRWLYNQHKGLKSASYEEQLKVRMDSLFGVADFYSSNLQKLGHEANDIIANNEILQKQWAKENDIVISEISGKKGIYQSIYRIGKRIMKEMPFRPKSLLKSFFPLPTFPGFYEILSAQIKKIRPEIILNQVVGGVSGNFLREMKPYLMLLVGQIASPLPKNEDFKNYDLMISSLPNFVEYFRKLGVKSEYHRLGFEPRLLERFGKRNPTISVSHIGGYENIHSERNTFLEKVCKQVNVDFWGYGIENLRRNSPIFQRYHNEAWGIKMYQLLRDSKLTITKHITSVAGRFCNNMRLYEATGVGTLLVTDYKDNLSELFIPGKEVIAYHSPEECVELIEYYLEHDREREIIARAGQERTLREHTYYQRMQELVDIVQKYV